MNFLIDLLYALANMGTNFWSGLVALLANYLPNVTRNDLLSDVLELLLLLTMQQLLGFFESLGTRATAESAESDAQVETHEPEVVTGPEVVTVVEAVSTSITESEIDSTSEPVLVPEPNSEASHSESASELDQVDSELQTESLPVAQQPKESEPSAEIVDSERQKESLPVAEQPKDVEPESETVSSLASDFTPPLKLTESLRIRSTANL
ncbi:hypothetical protein BDW74DRAFT_49696 [Aspergillus multicolor]|uniref:uncharacterized protein n=1 Tax=Aspergillus multicolor TaxID=41759 RepID=UPI003CCCCB9B